MIKRTNIRTKTVLRNKAVKQTNNNNNSIVT